MTSVRALPRRAASWKWLHAFSQNQIAMPPPVRSSAETARYAQYMHWCTERGITNAEYVLKYVRWKEGALALEPSMVPYRLEPGLQHWILWHHPDKSVPGDATLLPCKQSALVQAMIAQELAHKVEASALSGSILCFQNIPERRSIPAIAHAHVFLRTENPDVLKLMARWHAEWLQRSPFLSSAGLECESAHRAPD